MNTALYKFVWIFAVTLVAAAYISGLFIDLTGDSGLYGAISRQMIESGDWLNLKINCEAYDQKPHLLFWLAGAGIQLFGNNNVGFKIFPFLVGLSGFFFTYKLGQTLFGDAAGKIAALIAASCQAFFLYFLDIHTDSILQAGVTLALWQLAVHLKNKKTLPFLLGFFGIGLAMLSKGPVGAILPFFAVFFFLVSENKFKQLFHAKWWAGVLIVILVISPTLWHLYKSFGWEGLKFYFITNNVGRITGEYAGSSTDPFYYLYNMLWIFIPWTIFVLAAVYFEIKLWFRKNSEKSGGIYLLGSVLALLVVLSIAKGKAPNYFLIAVSPLSVITAKWLTSFQQLSPKFRKSILRNQLVFIFLFGIFTVFAMFVLSEQKIVIPVFFTLILLVFIFILVKSKANTLLKTMLLSVGLTGILNLFLNMYLVPGLFKYQGARQALAIYEKHREENDILLNIHLEEYELFFYASSPVKQFSNWEEFYTLFHTKGTWIYTSENGYLGIMEYNNNLDSVYIIENRGMNNISWKFIHPKSRKSALQKNYLIKVK